jgi:hypothetical protein
MIISLAYFLGLIWIIVARDFVNWENNTRNDVYNGLNNFYQYYEFEDDTLKHQL